MSLTQLDFSYDKLKLNTLYKNEEILEIVSKKAELNMTPEKVKKVYGELLFPEPQDWCPYIFTSFVFSLDGKIAFPDNPEGPLISKKNFLDQKGGEADFWILNVLRAYSDLIIRGAKTLEVEPEGTGHIFDPNLLKTREKDFNKISRHPINLIVSYDGRDIPLNHKIFNSEQVVTWINTSPEGVDYLEDNWKDSFEVVRADENKDWVDLFKNAVIFSSNLVICTGEGNQTNIENLLKILRLGGIKYISVESPSYTWSLIKEKLIDEMFINYSGIYVGGEFTFGLNQPFTSEDHPHTELIKIDLHKSNFLYTRQKLIYEVKSN